MIEFIATIALLCQVSPGTNVRASVKESVDAYQLKCQQYYVTCMDKQAYVWTASSLKACIFKREVK